MLQKFKQFLIDDLQNTFKGRSIDASEHIVDLTSSTPTKFSHHLIIDHPDLIFANNYHVGRYVDSLCCKLKQTGDMAVILTHQVLSTTSAQDKTCNNSVKGSFVDEGVYSKNRNFRLYLSSKFNKTACLKLTNNIQNVSDKDIFLRSLVTFVCESKSKRQDQPKYVRFVLGPRVCTIKRNTMLTSNTNDNVTNKDR